MHASYYGNGSGRDNYIIENSGGNTRVHVFTRVKKPGMMRRKVNNSPRELAAAPRKDPTAFQYRSDGTGRDSYII